MADDDAELIGGISVGIGANHAQLVAIVNESNRILATFEARWKNGITVNLGGGVAGGGGRAPAPAVRYGAAATTGVQSQQGQSALQQAINAQLAKTGERYNAVTGEITKATGAIKGQRNAIVAVQEAASQPTALNIDTAALQNDLNAVLGTLREIVSTAGSIGSLPAARIGVGAPASAAGGSASAHERAVNTDLATRIARTTTTVRRTERDEEPAKKVPAEYGANFPAIQLVDQLEKQRRSSREVKGPGPIEVNRSEQSLNRQRDREEKATAREQQRSALATAKASASNGRNAAQAALQALSAEAEATNRGDNAPGTSTFAPQRAQADIGAYRAEQARREAAAAQLPVRPGTAVPVTAIPVVDAVEAERRRQLAALNARVRSARAGGASEEDILRREEQRVAVSESTSVARGRTPRTTAAGFGGQFLFGGPARQQAEATARQAAAEQNLTRVRKVLNSPEVIRDSRAYRAATEEQTVAENELADATKGVRDLSGAGTAVRSLAAVSVAGAAFSVGMQVAGVAVDAATKAFGNFLDIETGFGANATRVTTALATQTEALHGNVAAALAGTEAQAGLSKASADALSTQLGLATQVKAGAQAQQQASELFRAGFGVGNAPTGLFGGYGGVGGTALLGQQLGGGRGFSETVQQDLSGFIQGRPKQDLLGGLNSGLSYATNPDVRGAIDRLAVQNGQQTPTQSLIGSIQANVPLIGGPLAGAARLAGIGNVAPPAPFAPTQLSQEGVAYINNLNDAAKRAAPVLGSAATAQYRVATSADEIAKATSAAAAAGDAYGVTLAQQGVVLGTLGGAVASTAADYKRLLEQVAIGTGITDTAVLAEQNLAAERQRQRESAANLDTIRAQQAYQLPSQIAAIGRQLGYGVGTQLPVQQTIAGLANPNVPVGTGIAPANAAEASRVASSLKEAQGLQDQLNAKYAQGQQIIHDTYDPAILTNFGQAAKTDFDQALSTVVSTGKEIAGIQAGISNEQAAYQTAQYNFQLFIAKRNLSDIGGLINQNLGAGESYYGQLERQNLLLGRQAQLLQFALSQRQINFQVAQAGFVVPGVTPEERQANIKEAQIEASFAQKQLNLSKAQFGNQVQLVDIGNLRQGADLVRQIGLLAQGRQVTIDTAGAEAKLLRLNQLQQQEVAKVGQYISAVDNVVSTAFGDIAALEAAAGKAMVNIASDVLGQFGIFINGLNNYVSQVGGGTGTGGGSTAPSGTRRLAASGAVGWLSGPTQIGTNGLAGEAGGEALLILSHPRQGTGSGGGGNTYIVNVNNPVVRDEADISEITRKVMQAMGKQSALLGLRSPIS